jgi:seryl-tRNA synthetase
MLDIKAIRSNPEEIKRKLRRRGQEFRIDDILKLDEQRRQVLYEVEELKSKKNKVSEEVAKLKKLKQDSVDMVLEMREVSEKIKEMDERVRKLDEEITDILMTIPNTPYDGIPDGKSEADNLEIRKYGEPTKFEYEPKAHWDIGVDLNILDFETAAKVTGARFTFYRGLGAKLERALKLHAGYSH